MTRDELLVELQNLTRTKTEADLRIKDLTKKCSARQRKLVTVTKTKEALWVRLNEALVKLALHTYKNGRFASKHGGYRMLLVPNPSGSQSLTDDSVSRPSLPIEGLSIVVRCLFVYGKFVCRSLLLSVCLPGCL